MNPIIVNPLLGYTILLTNVFYIFYNLNTELKKIKYALKLLLRDV